MTASFSRDFGTRARISSRLTTFHKRVFPVIWFGFLVTFVLVGVFAQKGPHGAPLFVFVPPVLMGVIGFAVMRKLIFDLADEVWDVGSALVVKKAGREVRVELSEIINVSSTFTNPPRVTLTMRHSTALGTEISFMPPTTFIPFARSPIVGDLIRRVDAARRV